MLRANQLIPGDNERLPQMAPYSPEACQASFERLAAWVDNSLAMHQPELSQVRAEDKKKIKPSLLKCSCDALCSTSW